VRHGRHIGDIELGDLVELPEAEGQRLVDAGVLEVPKASRRQSKK